MKNFWRAVLTVMVWLMLGGVALAAIIQSQYSNNIDVNAIAIPAMVLASITTLGLWSMPEIFQSSQKSSGAHYISGDNEKAKRDSGATDPRMALLMEMMDEHELQAFKERLKQQIIDEAYVTDDGEIAYRGASLEDLIEDEEAIRRHR